MLMIFLNLVAWIPALLGWGWFTIELIDKHKKSASFQEDFIYQWIVGMGVIVSAASFINFFTPINSTIEILLISAGWIMFLSRFSEYLSPNRNPSNSLGIFTGKAQYLVAFTWLITVCFIVNYPFSEVNYDTGLYHIQSIKWMNESRTPLGLANLHGRLGFNSSWFSLAAALGLPFLPETTKFFALPALLLWFYGLEVGRMAVRLYILKEFNFYHLYMVASALIVSSRVFMDNLHSPSPDFPIIIFSLLSVGMVLRTQGQKPDELAHSFFVVLFMTILATMVKLSALPLLGLPIGMLFLFPENKFRKHILGYKPGFFLIFAILLIWLVRSVILSGCFLYPVSFTCPPGLHWGVPIDAVRKEALDIMLWARFPHDGPQIIIGQKPWITSWFQANMNKVDITLPISYMLVGIFLLLMNSRAIRSLLSEARNLWISVIVLIIGIFYWFITAPDIRFGSGFLWTLSILLLTLGITLLVQNYQLRPVTARVSKRMLSIVFGIIFAGGFLSGFIAPFLSTFISHNSCLLELPTIQTIPMNTRSNFQGHRIAQPETGDQCWSAEIPCTPYFDENLRIQRDSRGSYIFFIKKNSSR